MTNIDDALILSPNEPHFELGQKIDEVKIDIDHAIIKHFSEHLYSSPNKAIEELVSNGFDALATRCYVYVPGEHVSNRVIVWDNGLSMDSKGLQDMWRIARSPKEDEFGVDRIIEAEGRRRAMIGKFGIGKLASYAVGHRISHICKTADGRFLSVSVNYRIFTESENQRVTSSGQGPVHSEAKDGTPNLQELKFEERVEAARSRTPIRELTAEQASELAKEVLPSGAAVDVMLDEPHWTLAVIEDLKDVKLYPKRLMWVLGNGMPLRPDFQVFVEDVEVVPRLEGKAAVTWNLSEEKLHKSILTAWKAASQAKQVDGSIDLAPPALSEKDLISGDPAAAEPAIVFPTLGRVTATVKLFDDSLALKADDEGRSYGFFLMVRGRLVNPDDEKLLLHDPAFGTFYRSQYIIRADGLDTDLLADRESLRRDTPMTRELRVLQLGLYRAARNLIESNDEVADQASRPESRLPSGSRELYRDPLSSLLSRSAGSRDKPVDMDEPVIERKQLPEADPIAVMDEQTGHFQVNRAHPFYKAIEAQAGSGKKAAATMRAVDLFAITERLTEGFLYGRGYTAEQVSDILGWRDKLFRSLAETYKRNPDDVALEIRAASILGKTRFELAVTEIFSQMGFKATQHGKAGEKDILVVAPLGPAHRSFIVEAKGSAEPVGNVTAALASAAAHRDAIPGAKHALIVAREFAGFKHKDEPAIIKECQAVSGVSVVTVETLVKLYYAMLEYSYPLDTVMDALFAIESPKQKDARVESLGRPLSDFDFRAVLDEVWNRQSAESEADVVPIRSLWQSRPRWRQDLAFRDFVSRLVALESLAGGLIVVDSIEATVHINHNPRMVADHIARILAPKPEHGLRELVESGDN